MNFLLIEQIDSRRYINRDQMGGLGINKMPDNSFILNLFSRIKENMIVVPLHSLAQIAGYLKYNGHQFKVVKGDQIPKDYPTDAFIIPSSINDPNGILGFNLLFLIVSR